MKHYDEENVYEANFKIFRNLVPSHDIINAILSQKGPEFVYYVQAVIERSKSITIQCLGRAIHFSGQFLNITKSLYLPIPYFLVMSLTPNLSLLTHF